MKSETVLITGSSGLIGSEAVRVFDKLGYQVHGIDNNLREQFFGSDGDTRWRLGQLQEEASGFVHHNLDIRDAAAINRLVNHVKPHYVIHCAAQPAHEYARLHPVVDFHVNVAGTLNLLEACHKNSPEAPFVFCSSSKVYGRINEIPFRELGTRFEFDESCDKQGVSWEGINERFPISGGDGRGVYGTGKASADLLVQEYGESFGMPTTCIRGNCMTGSGHSPAELHGFLAYLVQCMMQGRTYRIFGYSGKQVRDIIHSIDYVSAMFRVCLSPPKPGTVYNLGGGRRNSVTILEAKELLEELSGMRLRVKYIHKPREGDHRIYISDTSSFRADYPEWEVRWNLQDICKDLVGRFDESGSVRLTG